jgi:hypothetical protein
MNMISTGTFLPEMDASTKQATLAEKFAGVWEKKMQEQLEQVAFL